MTMRFLTIMMICGLFLLPLTGKGQAEEPYDKNLQRLSEILGSLHYLRNLCGEESSRWRDYMQSMITAEKPDDERKALLIARFNAGYRSFAEIYVQCTTTAENAIDEYVKEGQTLSQNIIRQFANQ